jgi:hypothetical protein
MLSNLIFEDDGFPWVRAQNQRHDLFRHNGWSEGIEEASIILLGAVIRRITLDKDQFSFSRSKAHIWGVSWGDC